jgi:hypothetical protein
VDTTRTTTETRAELATFETLLAMFRHPHGESVSVGALMEEIDEPIEVMRLAAALLVKDGRITVERKTPPEDSLVTLTVSDVNTWTMNMLASAAIKREAAKNAPKPRQRRKKSG